MVIEPATSADMMDLQVHAFGLTPTERRVMALTLRGLSTKQIAAVLQVSEQVTTGDGAGGRRAQRG